MTAFALRGSLGKATPALPHFRGHTADHRVACSVYQEIWKSGKLYEYPAANLDNVKSAAGPLSDGWGLTTDQTSLIMSDGSSTLSWVDPQSLAVQRTISVSLQIHPVLLYGRPLFTLDPTAPAAILWGAQCLTMDQTFLLMTNDDITLSWVAPALKSVLRQCSWLCRTLSQ